MNHISVEIGLPSPATFNQMRKSVGWEEHDENDIELAFKRSLFGVMIKEEKRIIGTGRIIGDEGMFYYIQDVIVIPEYQGKGIGKMIMDKIMEYIAQHRKKGLFIGLMSAKGKEGFYRKYGFIERPNKECGSGMFIEI